MTNPEREKFSQEMKELSGLNNKILIEKIIEAIKKSEQSQKIKVDDTELILKASDEGKTAEEILNMLEDKHGEIVTDNRLINIITELSYRRINANEVFRAINKGLNVDKICQILKIEPNGFQGPESDIPGSV